MFSSLGLFHHVDCPEQPHCSLLNCIFTHHGSSLPESAEILPLQSFQRKPRVPDDDLEAHQSDGPRKKRRTSGPEQENYSVTSKPAVDILDPLPATAKPPVSCTRTTLGILTGGLPATATRAISPPPLRCNKAVAESSTLTQDNKNTGDKHATLQKANGLSMPAKKTIDESLNPRMISNPPASHITRLKLIAMLHEHMVRLNDEVKHSQDSSVSGLVLSEQELIKEALGDEERVAKQNPSIYSNIVKLRIVALKKMKVADWKVERLRRIVERAPAKPASESSRIPKIIETGLLPSEEIAFLPRLLAPQSGLVKHGYVSTMPSREEVEQAREGVEASQGWEQCDRCATRFQVFPGRRAEDGALTTGGVCLYHPAKPRRPVGKGSKESTYACCNEPVGSSIGCRSADTHVFKISETKRLALVMQFAETPVREDLPVKNAVCFDCEMGYTTFGFELIRLTATAWPDGKELLDVLVRPLGEILDLNSKFSGVWPKDYANAVPFKALPTAQGLHTQADGTGRPPLRLVDSPEVARDLLLDLLTPETPLIGHALENDLTATRLIHPSIVDSVLLYPHPRGLPIRFGLKMLMKRHLDRDIQMGGALGHDSKEDARAAGDLVRLKVGESWKVMKRDGWSVRNGDFHPPLCLDAQPVRSARVPGSVAAEIGG